MSYFLVASLVQLRDEVNARFPGRDRTSDGWIGDASHQARKSSHNPDWSHGGAVRAIDIDNNGGSYEKTPLQQLVLKAAIGDPRVWYVISNGIIYSRTYGWRASRYTGSSPHDHHVHVSVTEDAARWKDRSRWLGPDRPPVQPGPVRYEVVRNQFLRAVGVIPGEVEARASVKRVQLALNEEYGLQLDVDGYVGEKTSNAWGRHEATVGHHGRPRVPDVRTLTALARGRFRILMGDQQPPPAAGTTGTGRRVGRGARPRSGARPS
jgi:hypothetical protein